MRSQRHNTEGEEHGIDLAPMLDFVLNLLIFFIITTSFVKEPGVNVSRAEAETVMVAENGNILIAIRPNGEIWNFPIFLDHRITCSHLLDYQMGAEFGLMIVVADKA